ncbi:MAG: hypothetical protein IJ911_06025 [Salinivirgaceae bacterium]|nr:hypothetical protein [Salinivirgaceae bacterium]
MRNTLYKLTLFVLLAALFGSCKEDVYYGNWRSISTLTAKGRADASAFVIGNKAYMVGGYGFYFVPTYFNATWVFDTEDFSWSECDTLPGAPRRAGVAFTIDGKGYYCGGIGDDGEYFCNLYEFDPEKPAGSQWAEMKADTFPDGGFYDAVGFVIDGIGYVGTGVRSMLGTSSSYYRFDPKKPEGSRWSRIESAQGASGRQGASAFVIGSKAYIIGGRSNNYRVASFECYDAATDEFTVISENMLDDYNIDKLYRYNASAFSIGNDGYLTCGVKFTGEVLRDTWRYTPDGGKGKWQMIGDFEGSNRYSATCFVVDRYGFLLCGQNGNFSTSFKDDVWIFSPDEEYNRRTSR